MDGRTHSHTHTRTDGRKQCSAVSVVDGDIKRLKQKTDEQKNPKTVSESEKANRWGYQQSGVRRICEDVRLVEK